jgi:hypothetical protein
MRFGTWNVMNLYRAGSITVVAMELARYKFNLVGVQEVRWDKGGTVRAGIIIFYMKEERKSSLGNRILYTTE